MPRDLTAADPDWRKRPRKPRPDVGPRSRDLYTVHGMTRTPTWRSWEAMKARCLNPDCPDFINYGARGISIAPEWAEDFRAFFRDMGERPAGMTLGRRDNEHGYEPGNCRWESPQQQANNRRSSRTITIGDRTQTVAEWAREVGTSRQTIRYRLEAGWPAEKIIDPEINRSLRRA